MGDSEEEALIASRKNEDYAHKWTESEDDESYFEFRIQVDDITRDVSLLLLTMLKRMKWKVLNCCGRIK